MTMHSTERSKTEISLCRLLSKCELRGRDLGSKPDWRLEKFIEAANAHLLQLLSAAQKPHKDAINEYTRRIDFLKKLVASQKVENPVERSLAAQMMSHGVVAANDNLTKEIHQKANSRYNADVREELFKSDSGNDNTARRRKDEKSTGEDLDFMLKQHKALQERATDDLLSLARTLKEQSQLANTIVKKDIQVMGKSNTQVEDNSGRLKLESAVLAEHNRRAWKCWLWVLLVIVLAVFINMVLFMRLVRK